jgi:hypothetical protein
MMRDARMEAVRHLGLYWLAINEGAPPRTGGA